MPKSKKDNEISMKDVIDRLDVLIALEADRRQRTIAEKAKVLKGAGLKIKDIAKILSKTESHIKQGLYGDRRGGKDRKRKRAKRNIKKT